MKVRHQLRRRVAPAARRAIRSSRRLAALMPGWRIVCRPLAAFSVIVDWDEPKERGL